MKRTYRRWSDCKRAITQLARQGYNYFSTNLRTDGCIDMVVGYEDMIPHGGVIIFELTS